MIKGLEQSSQPREKALLNGIESLTDEELLALLLRTGNKEQSVLDLSSTILREIQGMSGFHSITFAKLLSFKGINKAKAIGIMAALEFSKRINMHTDMNEIYDNPAKVFYHLENKMSHLSQEHFLIMILDNHNRLIAEKTKVLFAVALVENAFEDTCRIEVVPQEDILKLDTEKAMLQKARNLMGRILLPKFDVLVIDYIGKNISGDGQDPNVTGLYISPWMSGGPEFQKSVILDLTEESHGNANGVGMVDVTTRKLFDKIDYVSMYTNGFTSTEVEACKIPLVASTPEDAIRIAVKLCNGVLPGQHKIVWIKNTLELTELLISEPLLDEAAAHPDIEVVSGPCELKFIDGEPQRELI